MEVAISARFFQRTDARTAIEIQVLKAGAE
jgi:hypothetical protein